MGINVVARFQFEGVHSWPACDLQAVSYLRHPHRHVFHVEMAKPVSHEERETEVITFKARGRDYCVAAFSGPHNLSCETMARLLVKQFGLARCTVLEDGENGAEVVA